MSATLVLNLLRPLFFSFLSSNHINVEINIHHTQPHKHYIEKFGALKIDQNCDVTYNRVNKCT